MAEETKKTKKGIAVDIENVIKTENAKFQEENMKLFEETKKAQQKEIDYLQQDLVKKAQEAYGQDFVLDMRTAYDAPNFTIEINKIIDKQIDTLVLSKVREARKKYNDSSLNSAIQTANAYYKKILNSEKLLTDMRNDYTKAITKSVGNSIENKFNKLDKKLGKYGRLILPASMLGKNISNFVTGTIAGIIEAIVSNQAIAKVSSDIINTVNRLKKSAMDQVTKTFKNQIDYGKKLKKAVEDQIARYKKLKDHYIAQAQAYVTKLQNAILDQVMKWENAAINEISKFITLNVSSLGV